MALELDLELQLDDRRDDMVIVSVYLAPTGDQAVVDGVALRLRSKDGAGIGPRVLLPIAGVLTHTMRTTVMLEPESGEAVPLGAMVQVIAWHGTEQREARIPTDPATAFEAHVRGKEPVFAEVDDDDERFLEPVAPEERAVLTALYPWIDTPRVPPQPVAALGVVDHTPSTDELVDDFASDLGLDDESAEWLKDLLDEDDGA